MALSKGDQHPLFVAVAFQSVDAVAALLDGGADVNVTIDKITPLESAMADDAVSRDMVALLLDYGANPKQPTLGKWGRAAKKARDLWGKDDPLTQRMRRGVTQTRAPSLFRGTAKDIHRRRASV
mmetsp:Transcript_62873/g.136675  ORF Transcript_62873/g.136675 Transcript_62873/m.136675 type:complete len:124 (-) Transcript_62873:184-555(-)